MADNNNQLKKPNATFRFLSGQVLTLDDHQITTIPYLAAMVSSADRFDSARDEHGYYKLDPNINHQHFSLILKSLPLHSVRKVFTCLPEEENVIPIVALLDFLGLLPYSSPSLEEVDSTFFSTLVYSPYYGDHFQIVDVNMLQDMAVRFAIAMIKEEYEFDQSQVMDQIYWFVMFILSADEWFGPRLRHHVYTTAENCFAVFNPSLLKSLEKLRHTAEKKTSQYSLLFFDKFFRLNGDDNDEDCSTHCHFYDECKECLNEWWHFSVYRTRERRNFVRSIYGDQKWYSLIEESIDRDPLEMVYNRILEIMYARLQTEICQQARAELHQRKNAYKRVSTGSYPSKSILSSEIEILPKEIDDIFNRQQVQEEIDTFILKDVCSLIPKLEREHAKLVKLLRQYEENLDISNRPMWYWYFWTHPYSLSPESVQEKAFSWELLLNKLHKDSHGIVKNIRERVLVGLSEVALKQFHQWMSTQQEIGQIELDLTESKKGRSLQRLIHDLKLELRPNQQRDHPYTRKKNDKRHQYDQFLPKVSANRHLKHSKR